MMFLGSKPGNQRQGSSFFILDHTSLASTGASLLMLEEYINSERLYHFVGTVE